MKINLKVKKEKCADSCPLPLSVLPSMTKGVSKINYDEHSGKAVIEFDSNITTREKVIAAVKKMRYIVE